MTAPRTALAAMLATLAAAAPAHAHDSLAPPGAKHAWLPAGDAWVMQHWVPFDEGRLYELLAVDGAELERWLRDDHRTIAQLAERRTGLGVEELADRLLEAGPANPRLRARQRERTIRMLTQGHLAQHVLYHYFHGTYALENTRRLFGVPRPLYKRLRLAGRTPAQIGRRGGRTPRRVDRAMRRLLRYGAEVGVADGSHSRAQAHHMLRRRLALLPCFLRRPVAKLDPGNPYGDPHNGHGPHARASRNGLLRGSKQAVARDHPRSCWHEPPLSWTGAELGSRSRIVPARAPAGAPARAGVCHLWP